MDVLFVNAAFRNGSRTMELAKKILSEYARAGRTVTEVRLEGGEIRPLDGKRLERYNTAVASKNFSDPMFGPAKDFASAREILIAAPFWNYTLPAVLHDYLEIVCTQGITFDITPEGEYRSCCRAERLSFITTSGGKIPESNCAFGYIRDLCSNFWNISDLRYVKAEGLDVYGADVGSVLENALRDATPSD